jgi:hypothetical protein
MSAERVKTTPLDRFRSPTPSEGIEEAACLAGELLARIKIASSASSLNSMERSSVRH